LRTALGLRFVADAWELHADLLHAQGKARSRIAPPATPVTPATTAAAFAPPGYTVLDLGARWEPAPQWAVTTQLNNVTDARYWRWSDVRGLADTSAVKDAYTASGRHVQLSVRHDF
jgi:hemoglobin/transferrin/lactoferrin receptor protein